MSDVFTQGSFTLAAGSTTLVVTDSNITPTSVFIPMPVAGSDPQAWGVLPYLRVTSQAAGSISLAYPPPDTNLAFHYALIGTGTISGPSSTPLVAYDSFLNEVLPYVPECPELVAVNAVRNSTIEFCKKSLWYVNEQTFDLVAGISDYTLTLPADTELVKVQDSWYDNWPMKPKSEDELRRIYGWDWRAVQGRPCFYTQLVPDVIRVVPQPLVSETSAINLIAAITPTRSSTTCDSILWERWAEGIAWGARARLLELPQQSFYDPDTALKYRALFSKAIGEARIERNKGMTRSVTCVRPSLVI
jgi:hypothetical protein